MKNQAAVRAIFIQAIEEETLEARQAYLRSACGDDAELRAAVDALLAAHDAPQNMLDSPIARGQNLAATISAAAIQSIEHIGMRIGPYQLMEQIGEGGFGLVFVAHQERPVRRKVALKIVKPGMGSRETIARFEAERQAIAMMDHPNIAQVFDAGVTDDGRPYFVMELVRGVPITEFCDNHQLDIESRLKIFIDVCSAVHHAHQKGVIHRDIKPSNVLVTLHDHKPVAKVIDFGVAKAIGQSLTDKTIYTRFFSMIGTPLYMSPEQAEMSGLDVDTRSDIYSLGVLLYELLVGQTPLDRSRLDAAGFDELRRIIREEEPPRPSSRVSTIGADPTTVAHTRRTTPVRLSSTIRGDLDWIVMKSIEKDRRRRYESAAALAADLTRYLQQQPVAARPPSLFYQLGKFARRHRIALGTGTVVLLALIGGTGVSLWQMRTAMIERDEKEAALVEIERFAEKIAHSHQLLASAQTHEKAGRLQLAARDYEAATRQQPNYYLPWISQGQFLAQIGWWDESARSFSEAIKLRAPTAEPQWLGVPALLHVTGNHGALRDVSTRLSQSITGASDLESWEVLRLCLAAQDTFTPEQYAAFAQQAETWLARSRRGPGGRAGGPPGRPPQRQRVPPQRPRDEPGPFRPLPDGFPIERPPKDRHPDARPPDDRPPRGGGFMGGPPQPQGEGEVPPPLPEHVCLYITGLSHLRAGDWQRAVQRLQQASELQHWPAHEIALSPLAIAYFRQGDTATARSLLLRAAQAIERAVDQHALAASEASGATIPWFDLAEMMMLYEEAAASIPNTAQLQPDLYWRLRQAIE
ncbi:MAG: serine/threonine protein kinase [Planctomycetota bacterium]|nr:MAG: serine/threonine protein kinase [Planctomycetota bacterium]